MVDFATIDLETTGLLNSDRIVEIAIVRSNSRGSVVDEFESVVNPRRDIGASEIHGLSSRQLVDAPSLATLWTPISEILEGAILVAHNAHFDVRMLSNELVRSGREHEPISALCTLALMREISPKGPRRLDDCCDYFGIPVENSHQAMADARMTSKLLHQIAERRTLDDFPARVNIEKLPLTAGLPLQRSKIQSLSISQGSYLADLTANMDDVTSVTGVSPVLVAEYFNILDKVLEDRLLDQHEAQALIEFASQMGISQTELSILHSAYMASLCAQALSDGVVSAHEEADLQIVADLLQVSGWRPLLEMSPSSTSLQRHPGNSLNSGMTICFTGAMEFEREVLAERATQVGLVVKSGVSKSLDVLIANDATSPSGKARKARDYGIRIVSASVFLSMLENLEAGRR